MTQPILFDYWRSSASYRVRIALNLLNIPHEIVAIDLLRGIHRQADNLRRNPQGLVPTLQIDDRDLNQSLAIMEYLHETHGDSTLLPDDAAGRHRVRALSYAVAMEIHPICNTSVVAHLEQLTNGGEAGKIAWMQQFIGNGLAALETMVDTPQTGTFCHGDAPTLADICLVPQLYNARRWGVDLSACPRLTAIDAACGRLEAFAAAHPDRIGAPAA